MILPVRPGAVVAWALVVAACAAPGGELARQRALTAEMEGRTDLARGFWGEVARAHPEDIAALRSEAISWLRGTQISTSEGLARLDRYLARVPGDAAARREGVEARLLVGDWQAALAETARLPESDAETFALRARALRPLDAAAARVAVERSLALAPELPYSHLLAAEIAYELGDFQAVAEHAPKALAAGPTRRKAAYLLGRTALRRGDRAEADRWLAIHEGMRAITGEGSAAAPAPREGLALLADLQRRLASPAPDLELMRARWLLAAGELGEAEGLARDLAPALAAEDLGELGRAAYAARRLRLARELFGRLLELTPHAPGAVVSLALLDLDEGAPETARARLAALLAERNREAPCARCEIAMARAEQRLGRDAEALDRLRTAVAWAPWKREWVEELAGALAMAGADRERARILAELARYLEPTAVP